MRPDTAFHLSEDRFLGPTSQQMGVARYLYDTVARLPLVCPHGHVSAQVFSDPDYSFGTPTALLITPDHYLLRMLYSQGVPLEQLGIPRRDGGAVETDPRRIWQTFADHIYLFRATPSGAWLNHELFEIFDIHEKLSSATAQHIYTQIEAKLAQPIFRPRALFERFNIEVLCTTDEAVDNLEQHRLMRESGWGGKVLPTFRPDGVINLLNPGWIHQIHQLSMVSGIDITDYGSYILALKQRRVYFKEMGARATDHGVLVPAAGELPQQETEAIFQRAMADQASEEDAARFSGHMLMEMARLSIEDGLVMQIHPGVYRNHNQGLYDQFGPDLGGDIPLAVEYTRQLLPLLNKYGTDTRLTLVLFTLDESTYSRELAPLAGHYPAVKLGPPWWFNDSLNGMARYFDQVIDTAGLCNTAGFNDDTRAFCSIPARHDTWRRAAANWIAGLMVKDVVDEEDGLEMMVDCAYRLAKKTYKLE
jgi:glucuronate isomerase